MRRRDVAQFREPVTEYASVDALLADDAPVGVLVTDYHGSPLDLLVVPRGSDTTVIVFHTALSPRMLTLPVFSGTNLTEDLAANVICVSDPTLRPERDLKLAWFLGNSDQPLQDDLPRVLNHLLDTLGSKHAILFGASGGGFAALYYSAKLPGSLAVVANPQVEVLAYSDDATQAYGGAAFGCSTLAGAQRMLQLAVTSDVRALYQGGAQNTVGYIQNRGDRHHVSRHLRPFLRAAPGSERVGLLLSDYGDGHVPPPLDVLHGVLETAVSCDGRWTRALSDSGFRLSPLESDVDDPDS